MSPDSSHSEELILVDADDRVIGYDTKVACHDGAGKLHRAFSVFLFNPNGELLLQQRSATKRLWPDYWTNSCCSHPRRGEEVEVAARRRVREELNVEASLDLLFKFEYQAGFEEHGSEHELCSVFIGRIDRPVQPDEKEVKAIRFVSAPQLTQELDDNPTTYTPWLRLEWPRICAECWPQVEAMLG